MLGLSATYNYFLSYGTVDMRKGCFILSQLVRDEMDENPLDGNNVYIFLSKNRKVVKILHYERGFFVLYEKRPLQGRFKKPVFDIVSQKYQISWTDMVCFTESIAMTSMHIANVG